MVTSFIELTVRIPEDIKTLQKSIEIELSKHGKPLRWAITKVDIEKQIAQVNLLLSKILIDKYKVVLNLTI